MITLEGKHSMNSTHSHAENIAAVVHNGLCTGCGTCVGVCPSQALEMAVTTGLLLPNVDAEKCTNCRICLQSCPGFSLNMVKLNSQVFGQPPTDAYVGCFQTCYVGHSNDREVSSVCSSGGVVDELLIYALESGMIDGAVVARMKGDNPLETEAFVARNREEVLSASRSKYCPVATGVVLERLRHEKGRFAVVGLPCHIHGVRKAEAAVPGLVGKIALCIGLFCGHTVSFEGTNVILDKLRVRKSDVARLYYRGNRGPDSMRVELKNGRTLKVRFNYGWKAYWNMFSPFLFAPLRCLMCPDQFNELADLSVGDAWLREFRRDKSAESVVIVRTSGAKDLLTQVVKNGSVSLEPLTLDKVKESQAFSADFKKNQFAGRLKFLNKLGYSVPDVHLSGFSSGVFLSFVGAFFSYLSFRVSSCNHLKSVLVAVPFPLFRLYFGVFKCIFLLSRRA